MGVAGLAQQQQYRVVLQRRGAGDWYALKISPDWAYGKAPVDAGVQALERYMQQFRESVADLAVSGADQLRVLVTPMLRAGRPEPFTLPQLLEHRVRREAEQFREAQDRLERAKGKLKSALADAAAAGVPQHVLVRRSGWSRETLRKHAQGL